MEDKRNLMLRFPKSCSEDLLLPRKEKELAKQESGLSTAGLFVPFVPSLIVGNTDQLKGGGWFRGEGNGGRCGTCI